MNKLKIIYTPSKYPDYEVDYLKDKDILNDETIVIVPDQFAFESEKQLVKALGGKGLFNVQVYGMKKLIYEKALENGIRPENFLSPLGKELIIMRILKELNKSLKVYRGVFLSQKYASAISSQIDSLRMDGLDSEEIFDIAVSLKNSSPGLADKLEDLGLILEKYNSYMNTSMMDEIDIIKRLIDFYLEKNDFHYSIIVEGFTGMSNLEINLISAMASASSKDTIIRVISAKNGVSSRYSERFISQIKSVFQSIGLNLDVEECFSKPSQSEKNAFQFAELFDYKKNYVDYKSNIRVVSSKDKEKEIIFLATDILRLIREKKYEWKNFAVLGTDILIYRRYLEKVFTKFKIPYFHDSSIPVISFNYISFIVNSLKVISSNFRYKEVSDTIKLRTLIKPEKNVTDCIINEKNTEETLINNNFQTSYECASYIERHAAKFKISYGAWLNKTFWEDYFIIKNNEKNTKEQEDFYKDVISLKNEVTESLITLNDNLKKSSCISEMAKSLREYLEKFHFFEIVTENIEISKVLSEEDKYKKYSSIERAVKDVLNQLDLISPNLSVDIKGFSDLVEHAFLSYNAGITPPEYQTVIFGNIERTKLSDCKVMYIVGSNEGLLPSSAQGSTNLFSSNEINLLETFEMGDFKTKAKFMDKEIFDIYEKIIHAAHETVFTYSSINEKGDEIEPSNWVKGLLENKWAKLEMFELNKEIFLETGVSEPYFEEEIFNLRGEKTTDIIKNMGFIEAVNKNKFTEKLNVYRSAEKMMKAEFSKEILEIYADTLSKKESTYVLNISKLETQAACPFKYYVSQVLSPVENPDYNTNRAKVGVIIHYALADFIKEYFGSDDKEKYFNEAPDILVNKFRNSITGVELYRVNRGESEILKVFEYALRNAARPLLRQVDTGEKIRLTSKYEEYFSHLFIRDLKEDFLKKEKVVDKMILNGIIDRLDIIEFMGKSYLRIIDYKTGSTSFDIQKILNGLQLQLPTYLEAVLDKNKDKNLMTYGMFYTALKENFDSELNDDLREKNISKFYGLDGLFIDDKEILEEVDKSLKENNNSNISKITFTKEGISKNSPVANEEEFKKIFKICSDNRWMLLEQIINGDISIKPYKDSISDACSFCDYKNICKMDTIRYRDYFRLIFKEDIF